MAFSKMVDMRREPPKPEDLGMPASIGSDSGYPFGLCISLDEQDLEKLDLNADCESGDMIDLRAFAKVTSVTHRDVDGKQTCRVELQITNLSVENEATEDTGADEGEGGDGSKVGRRGRY